MYAHDPHRASREKEVREFSLRSITVTNTSQFFEHLSSLLLWFYTSPLAVITVVGLLGVLMVTNSAELRFPLADQMHTRSGIYHKLSFYRLFC